MLSEEVLCISCYEIITNPVCLDCYLKQFRIWLLSKPIDKNLRNKIFFRLKKRFTKETLHKDKCILCNRGQVKVCLDCFSTEVNRAIQKEQDNRVKINLHSKFLNYSSFLPR